MEGITRLDVGNQEQADVLVLFGISGDLAKKMLLPALYRLAADGRMTVPVIGVAGGEWDDEALRLHTHDALVAAGIPVDGEVFDALARRLSIVSGDFTDPATFGRLKDALAGFTFPVHYLAIPPALFTTVAAALADAGLNRDSRLVVEKPFGHDRESAEELQRELTRHFDDAHLLRVDHYLGSAAVAGLLITRVTNTLLAPVWNRSFVNSVQISLLEDFDVADRGSFYDAVGCVRDVIQNHLLQVLTFAAMEPPSLVDERAQQLEKWRVLHATRTIDPAETVRGQYEGYLDVPGVAPGSTTETYFATKLYIDNWRWADVPFYLRSGKALDVTATEVVVELRDPPLEALRGLVRGADPGTGAWAGRPNLLRFRVDGDIGIRMDLVVREPDTGDSPVVVPVGFAIEELMGRVELPYENILDGAVAGKPEFFAFLPAIMESWRIVGPVLDPGTAPVTYPVGSSGPKAGDELPGRHGWHPVPARLFPERGQ